MSRGTGCDGPLESMKILLRKLLGIVVIVALAVCVVIPVCARQLMLWREGQINESYHHAVEALGASTSDELKEIARASNRTLEDVALWDPFVRRDAKKDLDVLEARENALPDPAGNGVIAVLDVPKLGAPMPVYRGSGKAVLGAGVGHLEGTSLPIGGAGSLSVLVARQDSLFKGPGGLLRGRFFRLDRLIPGDDFSIRVLDRTLTYEVTQVSTVPPKALAAQTANPDADECVLMTETSGGRLLVRAQRIRRKTPLVDDTQILSGWSPILVFAAPMAMAGILLVLLVEAVRRIVGRRRIIQKRL